MRINVDYSVLDVQPTAAMQAISAQIVDLQMQYLELEKKQRHRQFRDYVVAKAEGAVNRYADDLSRPIYRN